MLLVAQQQLQRVRTGWEIQRGFSLPLIEMQVPLVARDLTLQIRQLLHIDQQMVVPCFLVYSGQVEQQKLSVFDTLEFQPCLVLDSQAVTLVEDGVASPEPASCQM